MTEPAAERLAEADVAGTLDPPPTGDAAIDEAMQALGDLSARPLAEHHDRLAAAHEVLHSALERADEPAEPA
jgi:hypothetical protein